MSGWRAALEARPPHATRPFAFGQMRSGFIAEDAEQAFHLASRGMRYTLGVHAGWAAELAGGAVKDAPPVPDAELRAYNLLGSADQVSEALLPYAHEFAGRDDCHLSFRLYHPYAPRDAVLQALESYGKDVVPWLRAQEVGSAARAAVGG